MPKNSIHNILQLPWIVVKIMGPQSGYFNTERKPKLWVHLCPILTHTYLCVYIHIIIYIYIYISLSYMPIFYASIQVHRCVLERTGEGWPEETIWWSIPAATIFSNGNGPSLVVFNGVCSNMDSPKLQMFKTSKQDRFCHRWGQCRVSALMLNPD